MPDMPIPTSPARPMLRIEGQDVADLDAALFEMVVTERSDGMAHAELVLGAWGTVEGGPGYTVFDRKRLEFGKRLEIRIGTERVFAGRISALEGCFPRTGSGDARLGVFAEDRLQDLRMTRRTRSFDQVSDADVAQQLASDHGLQAQIDLSGPTHAVLAQVNQSDLAFLRDRARALGAELWVDDDTLHVAQRSARNGGNAVALSYGSSLHAFDVRADLAHQRSSLTVSGWDPGNKEAIKEKADSGVLSSEIGNGDGGSALLEQALGARDDSVSHLAPASADEARAAAEAWLRQIGRRFVCGHGSAQPEPSLRAGKQVDLKGLGPLFDGIYTLTEVWHRFDSSQGLRTDFAVERPAIGKP